MSNTLKLLQQIHGDIESLPLCDVADKYFDLKVNTLKKKIKLGEIPQSFCKAIINDLVTIESLAKLLDNLQGVNSVETVDIRSISPIAKLMLQSGLADIFGSVLIPYKAVAEEVFEWKEGTAKSRLSSGAVAEMGLVTLRVYESTQAPVFVLVSDLADFLLLKRRVLVMKPLSDELLLQ